MLRVPNKYIPIYPNNVNEPSTDSISSVQPGGVWSIPPNHYTVTHERLGRDRPQALYHALDCGTSRQLATRGKIGHRYCPYVKGKDWQGVPHITRKRYLLSRKPKNKY